MKTLQIDEAKAKSLYKTASPELRVIFEETFGRKTFLGKVMDRIKSYEDACEELGEKTLTLADFKFLPEIDQRSQFACHQLTIIARALNEGWEPDWSDDNQRKWNVWQRYKRASACRTASTVAGLRVQVSVPDSATNALSLLNTRVHSLDQFTETFSLYNYMNDTLRSQELLDRLMIKIKRLIRSGREVGCVRFGDSTEMTLNSARVRLRFGPRWVWATTTSRYWRYTHISTSCIDLTPEHAGFVYEYVKRVFHTLSVKKSNALFKAHRKRVFKWLGVHH